LVATQLSFNGANLKKAVLHNITPPNSLSPYSWDQHDMVSITIAAQ